MMYLQEKGKLVEFYRSFRDSADRDPTGVEIFKEVLGVRELAAFQKEWEVWVLGLRYR
jgi:hypothetical protein